MFLRFRERRVFTVHRSKASFEVGKFDKYYHTMISAATHSESAHESNSDLLLSSNVG